MYALRDVTATVECTPLIVASILSKKLAEGIDGLVLDVKVGRGAFMRDLDKATGLAEALVRVGTQAGKKVRALLTAMDAPLGNAVGNASETREALEVLLGRGPADLVECTMVLGVEMLLLAGAATDEASARAKLMEAIRSGKATETMARMIAAQGGDGSVATAPEKLVIAAERVRVEAPRSGFVTVADAREIGLAAVSLGAGRTRADQKVDPAVGIRVHKKPGDRVVAGDLLAELEVHATADVLPIAERVLAAFAFADSAPPTAPLVVGRTPA